MKIKLLCFFVLLAIVHSANAQTLFTYGTHAVSKDEFLRAYNKNPDTAGNREEKLMQYFDLYVNFRLKLQAAYDEKADKDESIKMETENFKNQLTENFINKQADINHLMHEAFLRSQKDILVKQVFVKFSQGNDTETAYAEILNAYNDLKAGKNFEDISVQYSNDSAVRNVRGNIGYITVFTLPYSIENIIYNLEPGSSSTIYKSGSGYHIFKNAGERPALGRKKIEQLLFPTPPFYTNEQVKEVAHTADSVYNLLQTGTLFESLLPTYGYNYNEFPEANVMEIKVGDYSEDFEKEVFSLKIAGDISKPFKTGYGYNIVKLNENLPVSNDENDINLATWLQSQIQSDGRLDAMKSRLVENWLSVTGFKENAYNRADLWSYTDSAMENTSSLPVLYKGIKPETVLFQFTKKKYTVRDWIGYLGSTESSADAGEQHDYSKQMHDYIRIACNSYYKEHIEDFNPDAAEQLKEFSDANMIFYVMDKYVWSKATDDSAGLKKYYDGHKASYQWTKSVSALVVTAPDKATADLVSSRIKDDPSAWRFITGAYNKVYADSNRYEIDQLPVKQQVPLQKGFQTSPEINDAGDSYTFIYVMQAYPETAQKSFEEAKGAVINDYQQELEQGWITGLKKLYPVKIDEAVLKRCMSN
ncbi:MAG TPA: peptidylprolyl isomerase [Parafilimonas sp.]|nr:peptidylprolyl isomerase [Parafilimonas sp.]